MFANEHTNADGAAVQRFPWEAPPTHTEVIEVTDGIFWVRSPLPLRLDHVNCYVLDDGDGWTLVDTGMDHMPSREAWETLLTGPLSVKPIHRVVITHHHPDHIGLLGWFAEHGAEVWITRLGYALGRMMQMDRPDVQPAQSIAFRRLAGQSEEDVAEFAKEKPWHFPVTAIPLGFRVIEDGATLRMGGRDWTVHFGHGHAWDHATFWTNDVVLAGDQIIPGISSNVGVWALEPEADTVGAWLESCLRLREVARGTDPLILPGHKLPFRGVDLRLTQLIENHHSALDRIMKTLSEGPKTAQQMFQAIFMRDIRGSQYGLALAESVAHMNHLRKLGKVQRDLINGAWVYKIGEP
ncbi:MAG: MBL fold metallo-hydrolase [Pseudomonadota bacterium]